MKEPEATFSACFGAAFLVWHPMKYAQLLADKMQQHQADAWLVNTGWTGGAYGIGSRIKLAYTRAIIDAIHSGQLAKAPTTTEPVFGLAIPTSCPGVPSEILNPEEHLDQTAALRRDGPAPGQAVPHQLRAICRPGDAEVQAAGPKLGGAASSFNAGPRRKRMGLPPAHSLCPRLRVSQWVAQS